MKNQTKTQNEMLTKVTPSHEILKGLNAYTKRKTKSAKLTIMIKKQKEYILSLTNHQEKHLAVLQYLEIISAKQRFLPVSQRLTSLPTAESVLTDVLNANPSLGGKVIKEEPKLTKAEKPLVRVDKSRSSMGFLTSPNKATKEKPNAEKDSVRKPQAKPTTKVETKQTKQDNTLVNLTKSIADLAKSVSDLTAIVTANSKAIAELQKTKSQPAPKAQPKPKAETKPTAKATAKAEPKKKQPVLKEFSALADFPFLSSERKSTKVDRQAELMAQYFNFA